jgi:hypothetical protein
MHPPAGRAPHAPVQGHTGVRLPAQMAGKGGAAVATVLPSPVAPPTALAAGTGGGNTAPAAAATAAAVAAVVAPLIPTPTPSPPPVRGSGGVSSDSSSGASSAQQARTAAAGLQCSICLSAFDELAPATAVVLLSICQHTFCEGCIEAWWGTASAEAGACASYSCDP